MTASPAGPGYEEGLATFENAWLPPWLSEV
jgi:hypothetical protein